MSDTVLMALIAGVPSIIAAIVAAIAALRTSKLAAVVNDPQQGLVKVHELVNSRLSEALAKIDRLESALQGLTGRVPTGEPSQLRS
jgi:hypothetical protein